MSTAIRKALPLLVVAVFGLSLTGCLKFKQTYTFMPDGSGKVDFRIGFNEKIVKDTMKEMGGGMGGGGGGMGGAPEMADPTDLDIGDIQDNYTGFVAFTMPKTEETTDGWKILTFTGYFEDINKVKIFNGEGADRKEQTAFTFKPTEGGGYVLEGTSAYDPGDDDSGMGDMGGMAEAPEMQEMVKGIMESVMKGFEVSWGVEMPGLVTKSEGMPTFQGRHAELKISQKDMSDLSQMKKLSEAKKFRIECGPSQISTAEIKAFKTELELAKAEWTKHRAKAAAAKEAEAESEKEGDHEGEGEGEHDGMK